MLLSLISVTSLVQLEKRLEIIEARHSPHPASASQLRGCLIQKEVRVLRNIKYKLYHNRLRNVSTK